MYVAKKETLLLSDVQEKSSNRFVCIDIGHPVKRIF